MKNPEYRAEYAALQEEFALVTALLEARTRAGLTQEQVARRMKTTQAATPGWKAGEASLLPERWNGTRRPRVPAYELHSSLSPRGKYANAGSGNPID
jgi:hypothetical protein